MARRTDGQTDRQTESDAYEPTVHKHRCAQKRKEKKRKKDGLLGPYYVNFLRGTVEMIFLYRPVRYFSEKCSTHIDNACL